MSKSGEALIEKIQHQRDINFAREEGIAEATGIFSSHSKQMERDELDEMREELAQLKRKMAQLFQPCSICAIPHVLHAENEWKVSHHFEVRTL